MRITMDDLARMSGYSKATISRALNDDPRVKEETKKKIKELAQQYNYHPHSVASSLARKQTSIVGLLFPESPRSVSDPFFLEFLRGVSETLSVAGFSLLVPPVEREGYKGSLKRLVFQHRVDGVILTEPRIEDERITLLRENNVPFVFLGSTVDERVIWVDGDNVYGAYLATKHLLKLGHKQTAILLGDERLVSARKRFEGYKLALEEEGITVKDEWILKGDFTFEGAYKLVDELLIRGEFPPVTAIFASNDLMAIGALKALKDRGFLVPDDISLVGFDGIELTRFVDPPLTTIQQPIYELGREVSHRLLKLLRKEEVTSPHTQLSLELVVRTSTRPLKKEGE